MAQARFYSSTAQPTVLTSGITAIQTSINVLATTGFPASVPYVLALDYNTPSEEIVLVTAQAGTTLTVTRAYDGTSGTTHNSSAGVRHTWTAKDGNDSRAHEGSSQGVHGIGALSFVAGTLDVQTLSNKTLTAPVINGGSITGNVGGNPNFDSGLRAGSAAQFSVNSSGDIVSTGIWGARVGFQPANQGVTSSTTLVNSSIVIPLAANSTYEMEGYIAYDGMFGGNGGIKAGFTGPAGYTQDVAFNGPGPSGMAPVEYNGNNVLAGQFQSYGTFGTGGVKSTLNPRGWVKTAGTAGNLTFQFAQNIADGTPTTIYAGAFITVTRIA